jgi:cytochrome c oxidase subunit 2
MNAEFYEKIWMWLAGVLIVAFLGAIVLAAGLQGVQPPGHIETVNPTSLDTHPEFGTPGVRVREDGTQAVSIVAAMFSYTPDPITVPANTPVTFRITSADVLHGFQVVGTNANVMAVPGYVTQFTFTFQKAGEYLIACNEYCGTAHHYLTGKLVFTSHERPR